MLADSPLKISYFRLTRTDNLKKSEKNHVGRCTFEWWKSAHEVPFPSQVLAATHQPSAADDDTDDDDDDDAKTDDDDGDD